MLDSRNISAGWKILWKTPGYLHFEYWVDIQLSNCLIGEIIIKNFYFSDNFLTKPFVGV